MANIDGGKLFAMSSAGWVRHSDSSAPRIFDGANWNTFNSLWAPATADPVRGDTYQRILHCYTGVGSQGGANGLSVTDIAYQFQRGHIASTTWTNTTGNYTIVFHLQCIQDPSYDFPTRYLPAGASQQSETFDTAWAGLGYQWRAVINYAPGGDVAFGSTFNYPTI